MSSIANISENLENCLPAYVSDSIIVGNGEVPAVRTRHGVEWVLPGGVHTTSRAEATACATRLDELISYNLHAYRRKLLRL